MPLVDLKTNLKSLKYGFDQIGGGNSGQPFIQFPIEDKDTPKSFLEFYSSNRNSLDFPIRGGGLDYDINSSTFTKSSQIDKERIKKFLDSKPRGTSFIEKQVGLQLSNPKIQTGPALYAFGSFLSTVNITENTRLYNLGKNTLAQVGFSGTGIHANRHGIIALDSTAKHYSDIVGSEINLTENESIAKNRLLILQQLKMSKGNNLSTNSIISNINEVNKLGISLNKNVLFDYLGGPGSVYGIGKTTLRRYVDTRDAITKVNTELSSGVLSYDQIANKNISTYNSGRYATSFFIDPERKINVQYDTRENIYQYNVGKNNKSDKIGLSDPVGIFSSDNPWTDENVSTKDMIKFGFECINNDDTSQSTFLQFRAYLEGAITDNNQGSWNAFKYMGKGEDFYTYQGFSRTIGFSFKLVARSQEEMSVMHNKLNFLVSQVYPDYSPLTNMMRAPIVRLTIGDYLYRVPGILENVNITIDQTSPWEISALPEKYQFTGELPQYIGISLSFKPIPDSLPKRQMAPLKNRLAIINSEETISERNNRMLQIDKKINNVPNIRFVTPFKISNDQQIDYSKTGFGSINNKLIK
jgi:hypothetical protein